METDHNVKEEANAPAKPQAKANHQTRNASLQAGLDLIDQGFTLIDENLCMVAWNQTFLRLLDFPQTMGFVGAPFESFMRYNARE